MKRKLLFIGAVYVVARAVWNERKIKREVTEAHRILTMAEFYDVQRTRNDRLTQWMRWVANEHAGKHIIIKYPPNDVFN